MANRFVVATPKAFNRIGKRLKNISKPIDKRTADRMGRKIVTMMKRRIAQGQSPISKDGAFPAYRGQYRRSIIRRWKRTAQFNKKLRPVNLKLSGEFLKTLGWRTPPNKKEGFRVVVGFVGKGSKTRSSPIEEGHRSGANGQARRPIIPEPDQGEQFTRDIQSAISDIFEQRLNQIIRKR